MKKTCKKDDHRNLRAADKPSAISVMGEGTMLGVKKNSRQSVSVSDSDLNTHMLVAGTTGSGKTVTVTNVVESFIQRGLPIIYIDGKGDLELANRVLGYAKENGAPIWRFSMIDESGPYNPLASGDFSSKKDRIIELREWTEPHYQKLAEGFLQTVFKVLGAAGKTVDLVSVVDCLSVPALLGIIRERQDVIGAENSRCLIAEVQDQKEAEKQIESLRAELRNLARSELGSLFDTGSKESVSEGSEVSEGQDALQLPTLVLSEAIQRGGVAYLGLSPLKYPSLSDVVGKLIMNDFKASLDPVNPVKVLLVVDEFTTLAGPQVLNVLNQGRSVGVHGVLTIQSLADLGQKIRSNAQLFAEQIISNCNLFAVHRMNNPKDAETLANVFGTKKSMEITAQLGGQGATGMGSARSSRAFEVHPDDIKGLGKGEVVLGNKNNGTVTQVRVRLSKIMED